MADESRPASPKRSHADMESTSGQHGQRDSPVEVSSAQFSSEDDGESAQSSASPPAEENKRHHEHRQTQFQSSEDDLDPEAPLDPFDWQELEGRYHDEMTYRQAEEEALFMEFERLMAFFKLWAGTSVSHEVDRTFARLRTRMAHVQHSEESLEKKREHYINVVAAFERALELLGG
ncbi:hypothetical protein MPH_00686 [Macrophomina phaseolina MS6]|uniref:Uncharacterized protein n=2 Tax=Macrophomina phaseolina TaxID=35725 RepID=K2SHR2_MACPH|nr:hypothetical protein MPH_00686 [Macrophomina phaseolina MS6]